MGLGGAARWWLHHALSDLGDSLAKRGSQLILRQGDSLQELQKLIGETGARGVFWNRRYEPYAIAQDKAIKETLTVNGIDVQSFSARLLNEPWTIQERFRPSLSAFSRLTGKPV
jgi:deoxyribodipyrimidine photo-lyase